MCKGRTPRSREQYSRGARGRTHMADPAPIGTANGNSALRAADDQVNPASPPQSGDAIFRHLVDSVQDYAIFTLDPSGVITSWNRGAQRIKGYTASEAIGKHFSMFYLPQAVAAHWPQE